MILEYENHPISSMELCKNLNILKKVEYIAHALLFVVLLFFVSNTWLALLLNLPILVYHLYTFINKSYELDATELYKDIKFSKREAIVKIVYYVCLFGFYLFSFIKAVIDFESSSRS
jgi:hypothetical protein